MSEGVSFDKIVLGEFYDRTKLTQIWGYNGRQAISRGVVTPAGSNIIVLFVTKEKQSSSIQYVDYINEDYLYWDGEEKGINNQRIIQSRVRRDDIHLFYRVKHHQDFNYMGLIELVDVIKRNVLPYGFVFRILGKREINKETLFSDETRNSTEKASLVLSRIGQGKFRADLIDLWNSCSLTNVKMPEILKASHIKSWKNSTNIERLDPYNGLLLIPNVDSLFDRGFISFENDGRIIISKKWVEASKVLNILNISPDMKLRNVFDENIKYLAHHRKLHLD